MAYASNLTKDHVFENPTVAIVIYAYFPNFTCKTAVLCCLCCKLAIVHKIQVEPDALDYHLVTKCNSKGGNTQVCTSFQLEKSANSC